MGGTQKKEQLSLLLFYNLSDPARIQTWNLLIRSQILYSVELQGHLFRFGIAKVRLKMVFANSF